VAYIDDKTITEIRKKHPIKEIVERYVSLTKKGEDYWGLCPFHADNNASMSISTKLDMFQCFACHKAGNIFNFIANMENISYGDAIRLLAKEDGYNIGNVTKYVNPHTKDYEIMNLAIKFYQNNINSALGNNAIKYLENRQIDRDTIKKFEIGLSVTRQPLTEFLLKKYPIED
jgi:DNA primase